MSDTNTCCYARGKVCLRYAASVHFSLLQETLDVYSRSTLILCCGSGFRCSVIFKWMRCEKKPLLFNYPVIFVMFQRILSIRHFTETYSWRAGELCTRIRLVRPDSAQLTPRILIRTAGWDGLSLELWSLSLSSGGFLLIFNIHLPALPPPKRCKKNFFNPLTHGWI